MDKRRGSYKPEEPVNVDALEKLIAECYPMVQERVANLTLLFFKNARAQAERRGRVCFVTPATARAVVLTMIALTGGDILD